MSSKNKQILTSEDNNDSEGELKYSLIDFIKHLVKCIKEKNCNDLNVYIKNSKSIVIIKAYPYEILTTVIDILTLKYDKRKEEINNCCKIVLYYLAIYCESSEMLIYILEQMELTHLDNCFYILLKPLKLCLFRCRNHSKLIDTCIDNLKQFLLRLPLPNEEYNEVNDTILERIILSYVHITNFVDNLFIDFQPLFSDKIVEYKMKYLILDLLLSMFGKPISFINTDCNNHQLIFQKILANIMFIEYDVIQFFQFMNYGKLDKYCMSSFKKNLEICYFQNGDNVPHLNVNDLSLSNFYWVIFCTNINIKIVQVYNPYYLAYNCMNISNYLMTYQSKSTLIIKALDIMHYALNIVKNFIMPFEALDLSIHNDLLNNLINCILHSDSKQIKKYAANNFIKYINSFEDDAKYIVIKKIIFFNHPKIVAITIGILKNIVDESITKYTINHKQIFLGKNLDLLISKICTLDHGTDTDLIEISDKLITVLNFIIFIIIRSKKNVEILSFLNCTFNNFISTLKNMLEPQKIQWTTKLDNLNQNKEETCDVESIADLNLRKLPFMPLTQKIELCNRAVNTFFIMENIVNRIDELIE